MYSFKSIGKFVLVVNCLLAISGAIPLSEDNVEQHATSVTGATDDNDEFNQNVTASSALVKSINKADWPIFDERYDILPQNCSVRDIPSTCAEATACTKQSGYYYLKFPFLDNQVSLVECEALEEGGDWTVIQRRIDGSEDFFRNWTEYKSGFGNIVREYFIGLDKLHVLTNYYGPQELWILMENQDGKSAYARYDLFFIGNESEKYILKSIGSYSGTAEDSLAYHVGSMFSTRDRDNDDSANIHCAVTHHGAWWYRNCAQCNLNGLYGGTNRESIEWWWFDGSKSLKTVKMMIRRRRH